MIGETPGHAQSDPGPAAIERTIPRPLPRTHVAPKVSTPSPNVPADNVATGRFTLGAVHIEGAAAFSQEELSPCFEPYLATEVDESTLKEIAACITQRYRKAGYLLSHAMVPAQNVQAGIVRIVVFEGRINSIQTEGTGSASAAIEATAAPLLNDVPLRARTLERAIGLIRDIPGLTVLDVALTRSVTDARQHALKIVLARDPVRALAYTDNRGTDEAARMRFFSSASLSSLAITGDELRVDLFGIPGSRFRYAYGQATASVPLGRDGLRFAAAASAGDQYQRSSGNRIDGGSRNLAAQFSYPVLRSRALTLVARAAVNDWRSVADEDRVRNQRDRLRVARIGFDLSNDAKTRLDGEFSLSRGLGFNAMTRVGDPLASRPDASGRFTKAAFTFQAARPIGEKMTLQLMMAGQYSDRPLLSIEEFALGGNRIGRAFDFNTLTGDRGLGGGVEWSHRLGNLKHGPERFELFGYVDGGIVSQAGHPTGVSRKRSLMSVGLGNRFSIAGISFSVEAGVPVEFRGKNRSVRGFFSAYRAF